MSDHYRTLGLQPNASKSDIRNAYFRLAHRYHPDHHSEADAAGRAAAAASFRKAKDAYEVLIDDGRRAEYDRIIRSSSSASGNRHGQHGGGASSSTTDWESDFESRVEAIREELARAVRYYASTSPTASELEALRLIQEQLERALKGHGSGAYTGSNGYRNRQGQYTSSRSGYGHDGGTSSSTAWGHGGGTRSRSRPPPRPRPMGRGTGIFVCCAWVLGGTALLWSMFKRELADKKARGTS